MAQGSTSSPGRQPAQQPAWDDYAYVLLLYGKSCDLYFLGTAFVAWGLIKHQCRHRRVLLHTPDVPRARLELMLAMDLFHDVVKVEYVEASEVFFSNPAAQLRFGKVFTKYRTLGLERYKKVLFLDADILIRANLDELFLLEPPAAMARGPHKPPHGQSLPPRCFINAGVMLLRPDEALLTRILDEVTGPRPRKLANYNSPDADYLTDFPDYRGKWTSLGLQYNYQLEFEHLDTVAGTMRFHSAREAHFSEEGAKMPWDSLCVLHFSGQKPWAHLFDNALALQSLRVAADGKTGDGAGQPAPPSVLGEKLVRGVAEYAREMCLFQALCARLHLGEAVIWQQARKERMVLPWDANRVRCSLERELPYGGEWAEGPRPDTYLFVPPDEGSSLRSGKDAGITGMLPSANGVGVFLELVSCQVKKALKVGDQAKMRAGGQVVEIQALTAHSATVVRRRELPVSWQAALDEASGCLYYYSRVTGEVKWEYPDLPREWQAVVDAETGCVYYHNMQTDETSWDAPIREEVDVSLEDLDATGAAAGTLTGGDAHSEAILWVRSFHSSPKAVEALKGALLRLKEAAA